MGIGRGAISISPPVSENTGIGGSTAHSLTFQSIGGSSSFDFHKHTNKCTPSQL